MKQDVNVSGKIDGIPEQIHHDHDVVVELRISDETAKNIATAGMTLLYAAGTVYVLKSISNFALGVAREVVWKQLYPRL